MTIDDNTDTLRTKYPGASQKLNKHAMPRVVEAKNAKPTTKRRVVKSSLERAEAPEVEGPTQAPDKSEEYPSKRLK
jgi:hypothetical protein